MNNFIVMAEITQDPQIRYTSDNQTPLAEMQVQIAGLRPEDSPETIKVVGWGNLAQEIQEKYHTGDRVIIEGRLGMNTVEREGFKEKKAELTIQRIHRIEGGELSTNSSAPPAGDAAPAKARPAAAPAPNRAPAAAKAPAAKAAPAAAAPAQDYDDIPF